MLNMVGEADLCWNDTPDGEAQRGNDGLCRWGLSPCVDIWMAQSKHQQKKVAM